MFQCIFDGCDKFYYYQSSLKKHYLVSHSAMYKELLADHKIGTCGYQLNSKGEVIKQDNIQKESNNFEKESIQSEKEEQPYRDSNADNNKKRAELEVMKIKMVEKGVLQSQQIRENLLTQNMVIGKRGRPPGSKMNGSKRQKNDSSEYKIEDQTQRNI